MRPIEFPSSVVYASMDRLKPTLGLGEAYRDPALRRVILEHNSDGIGDVVGLVPVILEICAARPDVDVTVVTNQSRIPFHWCGSRVSTTATPPNAADRAAPGTLYFDISRQVRYGLYCPRWLQYFFITGIGTYSRRLDPFPLMPDAEFDSLRARLATAASGTRGYILLHREVTRGDTGERNPDPENLLAIARVLTERGYRVLEVGNDNPPSGEFEHLGKLSLPELIHAMRHCTGFFGVDSLPMQVAALYDKPILGFFSATEPDVVLVPTSRVTVLRNEDIQCNGCMFIVRPRGPNTCVLGHRECQQAYPTEYLMQQLEKFVATIVNPVALELPAHQVEHMLRSAQLLFEQGVLLDRLRGRRFLSRELRWRIAATVSSDLV